MQVQDIGWRDYLLPRLHEEGPRFVALFAVATVLLWWLWLPLGIAGAVATVWCFYFFRDPDRYVPTRDGLVVAPASGVVQMIGKALPPPELEMEAKPLTRVSVFMSVFDVHVNRAPVAGTIARVIYRPGKFLNAALDKASEDNERNSVKLTLADGREVAFVQIAGLVARRIRCDVHDGQSVRIGERYGLIRFGSRVDVYLPEGVEPLVVCGQKAVSGETVLADLAGTEAARVGEAR